MMKRIIPHLRCCNVFHHRTMQNSQTPNMIFPMTSADPPRESGKTVREWLEDRRARTLNARMTQRERPPLNDPKENSTSALHAHQVSVAAKRSD